MGGYFAVGVVRVVGHSQKQTILFLKQRHLRIYRRPLEYFVIETPKQHVETNGQNDIGTFALRQSL
jgi:hypothetical protein